MSGPRVALFATCLTDTLYPDTARAVVRLLERLGCEVDFPLDQTCCGQLHFNTGYADHAKPLARSRPAVAHPRACHSPQPGSLSRFLARDGKLSRLPWPGSKWTSSRDAPAVPKESFRSCWRSNRG